MTDYQNKIIELMKSKFGPAAIDFTNDLLESIGFEITSLDPNSIELFAKEVEVKAGSFISQKDAAVLAKELRAL